MLESYSSYYSRIFLFCKEFLQVISERQRRIYGIPSLISFIKYIFLL